MPSYPTLDKSWQFNVNQALTAQGTTLACNQNLLFTIVQGLTSFGSNPWQVRGSSNGTTFSLLALGAAGPGTGWASALSVVFSGSVGTAHSWIVLRQTALPGVHPEILLTCDSSAGGGSIFVYMSPSAGFTGGTTTSDPTATDQIQLAQGGVNGISFGTANANVAYALHMEMSTDGECTRMWVFSGNTFEALWIIDKVKNPVSGWTTPWLFNTEYLSPSSNLTWHNLSQAYAGVLSVGGINRTLQFYWTAEGCTGTGALITTLYNAPNDLSGEYPMLPIGLFVWTANSPIAGRHGMFFDLWYGCAALTTGQLYAGAAAHAFVQIGEFILPWDGSATMNKS